MNSRLGRNARPALTTIAGMLVCGLVAGGATAVITAPNAGAATTYAAKSSGRFLNGTIAGTSLQAVAAIQGEQAENANGGPTVINQGSLNVSALNEAIQLPLKDGLQLPGLNAIQLGAVAQYAQANPDGSAVGASGAINDTGGIGVGGSNGVPPADATLDLSGLDNGALTDQLGNLELKIGAVSATATQAAGAAGAQTGKYQIAGLQLELQSTALASLLNSLGILASNGNFLLSSLTTTVNGLGLGILTVTTPNLQQALTGLTTVNILGGGLVLDLTNGSLVLDLKKLLENLGLDLNNLPPNSSLMPFLVNALTTSLLPALGAAIDGVLANMLSALSSIDVKLGDTSLLQNPLVTNAVSTLVSSVTTALSTGIGLLKTNLGSGLDSLVALLTSVLDLVVNLQTKAGGTFTEQALQIIVGKPAPLVGNGKPAAQAVGDPLAQIDLARGSVTAPTAFGGPDPTVNPTNSPAPPTVRPSGPPATIAIPAGGAPTMSPAASGGIAWLTPLTFIAFLVGACAFLLVAPRARGSHSWS